MTTKLTITIDDSVIETAKKYAKTQGKSLSAIIENYLKSISTKEKTAEKISPKILKLMGSVSLPEDLDYKKELSESLSKKYLR
jgi:macrodomain Ter protein organizer (MatP/YcbG family)